MTKNNIEKKLQEETNQTYVRTIDPDEILKGKVLLNELPEPYLILMDRKPLVKLSKVINVIARKIDYRISFFSATDFFGYVIMEKKKEEEKKGHKSKD